MQLDKDFLSNLYLFGKDAQSRINTAYAFRYRLTGVTLLIASIATYIAIQHFSNTSSSQGEVDFSRNNIRAITPLFLAH